MVRSKSRHLNIIIINSTYKRSVQKTHKTVHKRSVHSTFYKRRVHKKVHEISVLKTGHDHKQNKVVDYLLAGIDSTEPCIRATNEWANKFD